MPTRREPGSRKSMPCPNHDMKRCLVLISWISETDMGRGDGGGGGGLPARLAAVRATSSRCLERVLWMSRVRSLVAMVLPVHRGHSKLSKKYTAQYAHGCSIC